MTCLAAFVLCGIMSYVGIQVNTRTYSLASVRGTAVLYYG